ncbi:hypothetical protein F383_05669 [Gossypium arboreum]|uniref:Uncharacterized protein n=1 Tax=Gossypium arboreum TaxID=29729 RepID=A0A0B0PH92_GOSAR|nr:hypothetical protein F383_05669 [Gossypium arboreum]
MNQFETCIPITPNNSYPSKT